MSNHIVYESVYYVFFFFFKQKTAYEIRNCDWSSDVCSSDLDEYLDNQSVVILKTKLDGKTLANHYMPQLEKAGWKKIDSGDSDSFIWSNWTFKDEKGENRNGILSFTKLQGKPNHYFASLKVLKIQ